MHNDHKFVVHCMPCNRSILLSYSRSRWLIINITLTPKKSWTQWFISVLVDPDSTLELGSLLIILVDFDCLLRCWGWGASGCWLQFAEVNVLLNGVPRRHHLKKKKRERMQQVDLLSQFLFVLLPDGLNILLLMAGYTFRWWSRSEKLT